MANNNYPASKINNLSAEKSRVITKGLMELNELGKPHTDCEVADRIDRFFQFCADSSIRPGVEALCCALHINRSTLFRWSQGQGCTEYVQDLIVNAKTIITAYIEQAFVSGAVNPAAGIFLLKNWADYKDTVSFEDRTEATKPQQTETEDIYSILISKRNEDDNSDGDQADGVDNLPYFD